ncbi:hypothetical protein F5Y16DRAFT_130458 [Xylariaceae sp. FL0255]|nr:hypothetical protein F5Y16DRAFT_130458 [Xylariaceae sp. FL0255]
MLPDSLSSSYRRYKDDTSAFITWLNRAAIACGYSPKGQKLSDTTQCASVNKNKASTPPSAPRLKGKARKLAKEAQGPDRDGLSIDDVATVKYEITTQELAAQVNAVSQSKSNIRMPRIIKVFLERAIEARERCSDWYEKTEHEQKVYDEGGHRFFIKILRDALSKLGPDDDDKSTQEPRKTSTLPASRQTSKSKSNFSLENRFSYLKVEQVDDESHLSPTEVALITRAKRDSRSDDLIDIYELAAEKAFEDAFAVFCFFEDVHRIRKTLKRTWRDCNSAVVNLTTATVVTQTAINMIHKAEQDLYQAFFPEDADGQSYMALASMMVMARSLRDGMAVSENKSSSTVDITPFEGFIFMPTARCLSKFSSTGSIKRPVQWPPPIMPLRVNYIHDLDKMNLPEHVKLLKDDEVLTQILMDLQIPDRVRDDRIEKSHLDLLEAAQEDIMLRTLRPIWREEKLTVAAVVASQLLLDIIDICGDLSKFPDQLLYSNVHGHESFDFQVEGQGTMKTGRLNWPQSGEKSLLSIYTLMGKIGRSGLPAMKGLLMQTCQTPKMYMHSDMPSKMKMMNSQQGLPPSPELAARIDSLKIQCIQPASADDFSITHNPVASGSTLLKLLIEYQVAGLSLANHHLSIFHSAHVYNALQQLKLLDVKWPIMERIIKIHKRPLFANDIPTKTSDMADRLAYRLNVGNTQRRFFEDEKWTMREAPGTEIFKSLLDNDVSDDRALWQVQSHMQKLEDGPKQKSKAEGKSLPRRHSVTPDVFLERVEHTISQELDDVSIDYIRLTKSCIRLIDTFRRMWNIELERNGVDDVRFETKRLGGNSNDFGHMKMCYEALMEAKNVRSMGIYTYAPGDGDGQGVTGKLNDDPHDPYRHGLGLLVASKVFKNFIIKEKSDFRFPLSTENVKELLKKANDGQDASKYIPRAVNEDKKVLRASSTKEFEALLNSSTYLVVDFYTDYDKDTRVAAAEFVTLAMKKSVRDTLDFARVTGTTCDSRLVNTVGHCLTNKPLCSSRTGNRSKSMDIRLSKRETRQTLRLQ